MHSTLAITTMHPSRDDGPCDNFTGLMSGSSSRLAIHFIHFVGSTLTVQRYHSVTENTVRCGTIHSLKLFELIDEPLVMVNIIRQLRNRQKEHSLTLSQPGRE